MEAQQKKDGCEEQLKDVQDKMNDAEGHRQQEMKKAEQAMNRARKQAEKVTKDANKFQQQVNELRLEIADLKEAIEAQKKQMPSCDESCSNLATVVEQCVEDEKAAQVLIESSQSNQYHTCDVIISCVLLGVIRPSTSTTRSTESCAGGGQQGD